MKSKELVSVFISVSVTVLTLTVSAWLVNDMRVSSALSQATSEELRIDVEALTQALSNQQEILSMLIDMKEEENAEKISIF